MLEQRILNGEKNLNKLAEEKLKAKLLRQIEVDKMGLGDQYNSMENPIDKADYEQVLRADLEYTPNKGETIQSYAARVRIYQSFNAKKNIQAHISGPKGAWWTHRNPSGCFCCEDMNLLSVLAKTLSLIGEKHPTITF